MLMNGWNSKVYYCQDHKKSLFVKLGLHENEKDNKKKFTE